MGRKQVRQQEKLIGSSENWGDIEKFLKRRDENLDPEVILLIKKNLCNIYSTNKKNILRLIKSQSGNCDPLQPLALALLESISLFKILGDQLKPKDLKVIFD